VKWQYQGSESFPDGRHRKYHGSAPGTCSLTSSFRAKSGFFESTIRQTLFFIVLTTSVLSFSTVRLWARLMSPPSRADVRDLAEKAPIVFRGRVAQIISHAYLPDSFGVNSLATIHVDRLYRGAVTKNPTIQFLYNRAPLGLQDHNCIDFEPDTYWLLFTVMRPRRLELLDDCEGALAISPFLGSHLKGSNWPAQIEADFLAGLNDSAAANRIVSIQRLGGLNCRPHKLHFTRSSIGTPKTKQIGLSMPRCAVAIFR
jgi:hypothetical protein